MVCGVRFTVCGVRFTVCGVRFTVWPLGLETVNRKP